MKLVLLTLALLQFGPRTPLTPAETLLEPAILKAILDAPVDFQKPGPPLIDGFDRSAGEIVVVSDHNVVAGAAMQKLDNLIATKALPRPARTIRFLTSTLNTFKPSTLEPPKAAKAAIFVEDWTVPVRQVIRSPWSTASIGDEIVELFARQAPGAVEVVAYRDVGQPRWDAVGIPVTTVLTGENTEPYYDAAVMVAASVYFLATLPNAGAEALLSHLTVGAHARLAEDGRKAVAQMGNQQRASADVLIMFGQAIEREQRRMRSFEAFMPAPVDPMLRSRIADMEKGITSVWTSMGITSSPFVPAAERIRGRGGEDRRVPSTITPGPLPKPELPTAFLKFPNVDEVVYELGNFIDGKRSISDIRDAVSAEFAPIALPVVVEYFERLAKAGAISIK
jgi:hypothetical protein